MVELRKRPAPPPAPPPAKKRATTKPKAKKEEAPSKKEEAAAPKAKAMDSNSPPKVGDTITLEGFGGEVETNDEKKTTLAKLVEESKAGVVLFTYPKASTPGCKLNSPSNRPHLLTMTVVLQAQPKSASSATPTPLSPPPA